MNYFAAFGIAFLFFVGLFLDQHLKTGYFFAFSGIMMGIVYIVYEIWKSLRKD